MINDYKAVNSFSMAEEANSSIIVEIKLNQKTRKKSYKDATLQKHLKFSCYQDLSTRNVTKNDDADRSINSFITRINIIDKSFFFEQKSHNNYYLDISFPSKHDKYYYIPDELDKTYKRLAQLSVAIKNTKYEANYNQIFDKAIVETLIVDLINIKQEIVKIWNKYNPTNPYKYGYLQHKGCLKLEDEMLDFVQVQLFSCYFIIINDDRNKQLILDQLIEQRSTLCTNLLAAMFFSNISNHNNLDKLNFKNILTKFSILEESYSKVYHSRKHNYSNRHNCSNELPIMASIIKLLLNKTCIDYSKLNISKKLSNTFTHLVGSLVAYYISYDYTEKIKKLSLRITFYLSKLDNSLFKEFHATLLTANSMVFIEKFSSLMIKLKSITDEHASFILSQKNKNKSIFEVDLDAHNIIYSTKKDDIQQKIKQLFIKYNIPTNDITSWYDTFIEDIFTEILLAPADIVVTLAQWIDLSKKAEAKQQTNIKNLDTINSWLDILVYNHKKLSDDKIAWHDIPTILLLILNRLMTGKILGLTFGTPNMAKQEDLAILYAKTAQVFTPFLGTALLAIANKDSYDDLLTDLDMLEFISQQTGKTKYIKSSQYLTAQIITYLINQNDNLDLTKKQLLFTKAEKLYLELASSGINRAYLLLAETVATLAKAKMYEQNFLEAADLYCQASSYCKILSEAANIDTDLQDLAITSMNCFSSEADVLRKISEEQTALIQELTAPKTTIKNKKKSCKQTANISTEIDKQDLSTEISVIEFANWHKTYKTTASKLQSIKSSQTKKTEVSTQLPSKNELDTRRDFWITIKEFLTSSTNLATSYTFLVKLTKNNYFKILESQFKDGTTQSDSWVVLLVYQKMAYYHFLQLKYAREIGNNANKLKLFYVADSKTPMKNKEKKITFENISTEIELLIRNTIKLVFTNTPDIKTKDLREIFLSLSPYYYRDLPPIHKNQLASLVSTYGHLKSLDDIEQGRRGKARLAAGLYDKADEINPNRLIRKQEGYA